MEEKRGSRHVRRHAYLPVLAKHHVSDFIVAKVLRGLSLTRNLVFAKIGNLLQIEVVLSEQEDSCLLASAFR